MNSLTKLITIALIVIIVTGVSTYAAYTYIQNNHSPPTPTPSPTATPTPTGTPSPSPTGSATASPTPTASPTTNPTASPTPTPNPTTLKVATTTSLYDTGLEDTPETLKNGTIVKSDLKDAFQAKYPWITINFIPLGTGPAIATAQRGDADMLLVHSPSQELAFLKNGYGVNRKIVAYNYFVIVGPESDPAGVLSATSVSEALQKIYYGNHEGTNAVLWFSRNDASGTNTKEISLWKAAGINYNGLISSGNSSWFKTTGTGMGQTLLAANYYGSIGGYTISDTGTYLAYSTRGDIQLKVLVQAQQSLLNVYSAIICDPRNENLTATNFDASMLFVDFLVSAEGQELIGNYGYALYNQSLFTPFVPLATNPSTNPTLYDWIRAYAYMDSTPAISASGTECPPAYRYNAGNLYSATYDTVANTNSMMTSFQNYHVVNKQRITTLKSGVTSTNSLKA